jgi:hypothetical protein
MNYKNQLLIKNQSSRNCFIIENLPHTAIKNIISKFILNIENDTNVRELFDLLSISKFFDAFDKEEIIKELYEFLKNKNMIKIDIINSTLSIRQKIHTYTSGYCQNCYTYNNPQPIYYINKGYFCNDCFYSKTMKEHRLKKYGIKNNDLESIRFFNKRNKKYYFIDDIEEKINMKLYDYNAFLNKKYVTNTHGIKYYNMKTLRNLIKDKEYNYKFVTEYTDFDYFRDHSEYDLIDFEDIIREADICYEKFINIIEILKNKEYDYEYIKTNILIYNYSLYEMSVEKIISKADKKYNSIEDSDYEFGDENSISSEEEYQPSDSDTDNNGEDNYD